MIIQRVSSPSGKHKTKRYSFTELSHLQVSYPGNVRYEGHEDENKEITLVESLAEVSLLQHSGNKGWSLTTRTDESEIFV